MDVVATWEARPCLQNSNSMGTEEQKRISDTNVVLDGIILLIFFTSDLGCKRLQDALNIGFT